MFGQAVRGAGGVRCCMLMAAMGAVSAVQPAMARPAHTEEAVARSLVYQMQNYPQQHGFYGFGCGFSDLDGDMDPDVILIGAADGHVGLFENDGAGNFTNRSVGSGMPLLTETSCFSAGDYDGDGDNDIYLTQVGITNYLMRNDGDFQFTDVTAAAGVGDLGATKGAAWGDFNNDGWLDLYVCNYSLIVPGNTVPNKLYQNNGDGTFTDVAAAQGVNNGAYSFQVVWFDYDLDGDVDLYLSNDRGHLGPFFGENQLWRNDNGTLVNVSAESGAGLALFSMGIACADFDGNGYPDLYCTNIDAGQFAWGVGNPLLLNQGDGTFIESAVPYGIANLTGGTSWGAIFYDYDNDGILDLYVNNQFTPNCLYSGAQGIPYHDIAPAQNLIASEGISFGSAIADVDADGDLDLLVNNLSGNVELFMNQDGTTRNWVRYNIVDDGNNRFAIGANVNTRTGPKWRYREIVVGGNTYCSQNELTVHVGVNTAPIIDEIQVRWPGGSELRTLTNYPINQTWTLYPAAMLGDSDGSGSVDLDDFLNLVACYNATVSPGCEVFDMDGNGTINSADYQLFLAAYDESLADCDENSVRDITQIINNLALDMDGDGHLDNCDPAEPCPGNATEDAEVNVFDLLAVLSGWGPCVGDCPPSCAVDVNGDCATDVLDVLDVLSNWGPCR